jgi:hypothetical protein
LRNLLHRPAVCSDHELADTAAPQEGWNQQEENEEDRVAGVVAAAGRGRHHLCGSKDSRELGLLKLRLLYPYALLLKQPQLGLTEQSSDSWSQIMLYAQWVLYGLYATVATKRMPLWKVLMQIAVVHLLGFSVLWLLAR